MYQFDGINGGHKKVDYNTAQFWNTIEHIKNKENLNIDKGFE